jgi:outer membrane protein assembly factor BamD (BamD/ComL family)
LEATPSKPAPALLPEAAPADHPVAATKPAKSKLRTTSRDLATDAEVPLLEQAHRALSESSVLALKLAREHERRFPSSTLDQERDLIEVTALVDLGRMDEARRLAHRFSEQHPGSAYVGRIDRIVRQASER